MRIIHKTISGFIIFLMLFSAFSPTLAIGKNNHQKIQKRFPLIVTFGDSPAEIQAVERLTMNFPNSLVIDFSNARDLILTTNSPIIYVGHSSEKGIQRFNTIISWTKLGELISNSNSLNHYILGCNSKTIQKMVTNKHVVAFGFEIDALLGADLISYVIYKNNKSIKNLNQILQNILNRIDYLQKNPSSFLPLRFGGEETYTMGIIALTIFIALWPCTSATVAISAGAFAYGLLSVPGALYTLLSTLVAYINGKSVNLAGVLNDLWAIIDAMADVIAGAIGALAWYKAGAAWACFSADTTSNAVATVAKAILLATAIGVVMTSVMIFLIDYVDSDTVIG